MIVSRTMTGKSRIAIANNRKSYVSFRLAYLHLTLVFLQVQVRVMHISIVNISQTVKDMVEIGLPSNIMKSHMGFRLADLVLILTHSKGQGQDNAQFECEYF